MKSYKICIDRQSAALYCAAEYGLQDVQKKLDSLEVVRQFCNLYVVGQYHRLRDAHYWLSRVCGTICWQQGRLKQAHIVPLAEIISQD